MTSPLWCRCGIIAGWKGFGLRPLVVPKWMNGPWSHPLQSGRGSHGRKLWQSVIPVTQLLMALNASFDVFRQLAKSLYTSHSLRYVPYAQNEIPNVMWNGLSAPCGWSCHAPPPICLRFPSTQIGTTVVVRFEHYIKIHYNLHLFMQIGYYSLGEDFNYLLP